MIEAQGLLCGVTHSINVTKQLVQDVPENNWQTAVLEELLAHLVEVLKA